MVVEMWGLFVLPALVVLTGGVGTGKTTLVRAFVERIGGIGGGGSGIGGAGYALVQKMGRIVHGDFYRLGDASEIVHLGLPLVLEDADAFFVEWGRDFLAGIEDELPRDFCRYEICLARGATTVRRTASLFLLDKA